MNIVVVQDQKQLSIKLDSVQSVIKEFLALANKHYDEVTIHFVENEVMCDLHADYFGDPSPTDCISFPMDEAKTTDSDEDSVFNDPLNDPFNYLVMGDVFVCPQTAITYVQEHGGDVYEEVTLYVIHGLLHLIGYDDIEEADREQMRAAERFHLDHLRQKNRWICA